MWHQIYEISWGTPWHPKVSGRGIHRFESIQVPCCQVLCKGKLLWGSQRTASEARGGQRMNIKQCAPFLDRTNGRVRRRRRPGEQSQEERKEEPFFKLIVCFTTPTPAWGGFQNHFHHRGNTCPGFLPESAPFLLHTSHSYCAHNKKWGLCGLKRGLVLRLVS